MIIFKMADRRAVNKYYPPEWDPSKGSINKFNSTHHLRDRAKKIDQGILVIRFEMPFNVWCLSCDNHIAMGVRYNAEKSIYGNYFSTPVYKFKAKCHLCDNYFEIKTDPANFDYEILSGLRKQARPTDVDGILSTESSSFDQGHHRRLICREAKNAMEKLELQTEVKLKAEGNMSSIQAIQERQSRWKDSFSANQLIRSQFRIRRKQIESAKMKDKQLLKRASLRIKLVPESARDTKEALSIVKEAKELRANRSEIVKRKDYHECKLSL